MLARKATIIKPITQLTNLIVCLVSSCNIV
nr:MAG TPA: hypothetical protein [Caudoviricetes sp.]